MRATGGGEGRWDGKKKSGLFKFLYPRQWARTGPVRALKSFREWLLLFNFIGSASTSLIYIHEFYGQLSISDLFSVQLLFMSFACEGGEVTDDFPRCPRSFAAAEWFSLKEDLDFYYHSLSFELITHVTYLYILPFNLKKFLFSSHSMLSKK